MSDSPSVGSRAIAGSPFVYTAMNEYLHDYFTKEEEFLAEYAACAQAAAAVLKDDWLLNPKCNDVSRQQRDSLLRTGQLLGWAFDAAAVYHREGELSSVRIVLRSSKRTAIVRVACAGGELFAEKIADK